MTFFRCLMWSVGFWFFSCCPAFCGHTPVSARSVPWSAQRWWPLASSSPFVDRRLNPFRAGLGAATVALWSVEASVDKTLCSRGRRSGSGSLSWSVAGVHLISSLASLSCIVAGVFLVADYLSATRTLSSGKMIGSAKECEGLYYFEEANELPNGVLDAGYDPPEKIVAVVRPGSFDAATTSESPEPKYILEGNFEMTLEIKLRGENKSTDNVT